MLDLEAETLVRALPPPLPRGDRGGSVSWRQDEVLEPVGVSSNLPLSAYGGDARIEDWDQTG